jgi:hypothetical protein
MIRLTITPRRERDIYSLLTQQERMLRGTNTTFSRSGPKRKDRDKWKHARFKGWIQFQRCLGGVLVAEVKSRDAEGTWALLTAFIGYVDRHFRANVANVSIHYDHTK